MNNPAPAPSSPTPPPSLPSSCANPHHPSLHTCRRSSGNKQQEHAQEQTRERTRVNAQEQMQAPQVSHPDICKPQPGQENPGGPHRSLQSQRRLHHHLPHPTIASKRRSPPSPQTIKHLTKQELCDHQSLLARWYFRPQGKREGELILTDPASDPSRKQDPLKPLLRACARVYRAHVEKTAPRTTAACPKRTRAITRTAETLRHPPRSTCNRSRHNDLACICSTQNN